MSKDKTKKRKMKRPKKSPIVTDDNADVSYDFVEDDLAQANETVASDSEQDSDDERKRQKLVEAISSLGGSKRKKKQQERSEPAVQKSEFTVNAAGEGDKINMTDLMKSVHKIPAVSQKAKKQLNNLQQNRKTIQSPLSRQESERIQRNVAFKKVATEVTQWENVIQQNLKAEQLVFPLNQESSGPQPMERVAIGWKAQTPLEQEIFSILSANNQPITDPVLTPAEEASMKAMSLQEIKMRRAALQKARALQSYYEAKAHRERKIKSKKYHRVLNKEKRKKILNQFEEMVKNDPSAALEELNKMELARMQERMSLKHQNSSKWARSKAIMAKYDESARKAMQQQLEVHKNLTQKLTIALDDEEEETETPENMPDFINEAPLVTDSNPWMRGKLSEDPAEKEKEMHDLSLTPEVKETVANVEEEEESDVGETEEESLLREFENRRKMRQDGDTLTFEKEDGQISESCEKAAMFEESEDAGEKAAIFEESEDAGGKAAIFEASGDTCEKATIFEASEEACEKADIFEESEDASEKAAIFEESEDVEKASIFEESEDVEKMVIFEQSEDARGKAAILEESEDTSVQLAEGQTDQMESLEFMELLKQVESVRPDNPPAEPQLSSDQAPKKQPRGIQLKKVLTKDTDTILVPLAPTAVATDDSDETLHQTDLIHEAFAGDDVISDFMKDKKKQEDSEKPAVVDLTLPGWGEWGGAGLKPSLKKRRRFRVKPAPAPPRKDQKLPNVIFSEKRNSSLSLHQVNAQPFPCISHAQFESTMRCPLGRTWNTERTVQKLTKPKVLTRLGTIIEPMSREELTKDKNISARDGSEEKLKSNRFCKW